MKNILEINKSVNANFWVLVNLETPFIGLERFTKIQVNGHGALNLVSEFRFSKDGYSFSEWKSCNNWNLEINETDTIWFNFRIKSDSNFNLDALELEWEKGKLLEEKCIFNCRLHNQDSFIQKCGNIQHEYNTAFGAIDIWENMSMSIFQRFGWPIIYFKADAIKQSKDFVFNEHSLLEVNECKKMQIVIPGNDFGSGDYQFTEFDIDFADDLNFQISKEMFWTAFGHLTMPAEKDFIYFPLEGKMFRINSVQESKDYMRKSFWWKGTLVKWNDSDSIYKSDKIKETLDEIILNYSNTDFEQFNELEGQDLRVEQQYVTRNIGISDNVRENVDIYWEENGVVRENLTNYFSVFSKYQYNLKTDTNREIIKYKNPINCDDSFSLMFWYKGIKSEFTDLKLFGDEKEISLAINNTIQSVTIFDKEFTVNVPLNNWYAWYIGVNKLDNTLTLRIFERQDNTKNIQMKILFEKTCSFNNLNGQWTPRLYGSSGFITSIRFLKKTIKLEDLSTLFTQLIFKDSSNAYIIDECWKIINLEKFSGR